MVAIDMVESGDQWKQRVKSVMDLCCCWLLSCSSDAVNCNRTYH